MPEARELLARELEFEVALAVANVGVELRRPGPPVPDHDRAGAIFAFGDHALEAAILQGMVLDLNRKALLAGDEARAFGHGPALQHSVQLEAEIIVKPPGGMLLDDIGIAGLRFAPPASRLRRLREVPLRLVRVEWLIHGGMAGAIGAAEIQGGSRLTMRQASRSWSNR